MVGWQEVRISEWVVLRLISINKTNPQLEFSCGEDGKLSVFQICDTDDGP